MEAKRVVFVSLKPADGDDAQANRNARRKRALGIDERATWEEFTRAVCARLQIGGLRAVYHASTGERVRGVEDVVDIEDLIVEEDESARVLVDEGSTPGPSPMRTASSRGAGSARSPLAGSSARDREDEDADGKNKPKRMSVLLSNFIPGLGSAVSDSTLRKLDSALDAAERGDEEPRRGGRSARVKAKQRKKRMGKRAILLIFIVFIAAIVWASGRYSSFANDW